MKKNINEIVDNKIENKIACFGLITPLAIGLNFLILFFLSVSKSRTSFIIYTDEAIKLKNMNEKNNFS